jgi:hypothetical protein
MGESAKMGNTRSGARRGERKNKKESLRREGKEGNESVYGVREGTGKK